MGVFRGRLRVTAIAAVLCLTAGQAQAQSFDGIIADMTDTIGDVTDIVLPGVTNIRLGAGPVIAPAYEGSDDYKVRAAPLISLRYRNIILVDNNRVRVNLFGRNSLFESENFEAGPMVKLDFGRDETDSADLTGLGDVGTSLELGVFASYIVGPARARIRVHQDVASGHSGLQIEGDLSLAVYRSDRLAVSSRLSATWADGDYMDSFFGVTAAQALGSGLAIFDAGSGIKDISLAFGANYQINPKWALVANGGYSKLLDDAKSSPIVSTVGSSNQFTAGLFAVYSF